MKGMVIPMCDDGLIKAMGETYIKTMRARPFLKEAMAAVLALVRDHDGDAWQPIKTAPKDGTAVLMLLSDSDIPHAVRWHARSETWVLAWDGYQLSRNDAPRGWIYIPAVSAQVERG